LQTTDLNTEIYLETYIDTLQPKDRSWYSFFNILTEDMLAKHAIINRPFIDLMHKTKSGVPRKARFYWRQCAKVTLKADQVIVPEELAEFKKVWRLDTFKNISW